MAGRTIFRGSEISPPLMDTLLSSNNMVLTRAFILARSPITHSTFKPLCRTFLRSSGVYYRPPEKRSLSFAVCCKLGTAQDKVDADSKGTAEKIVAPERAPSLSKEGEVVGDGGSPAKPTGPGRSLKRLSRRVLAVLANLPLAIGEMFTIAGLMALGMFYQCWVGCAYIINKMI